MGLATAVCCAALPAVAGAHGPPNITAGPSGQTTETSATFTFAYDEPAPTQTFECSLDGADFAPCEDETLPEGSESYTGLAVGAHTFKVRRVTEITPVDPLSDPTPAERTWTIIAPDSDPEPAPAPTLDADKPGPCNGTFQITDPQGDYHHENTDVLGGFFRHAGGTLTANVLVKTMSKTVSHDQNRSVFWRMQWTSADGKGHYVQASADRNAGGALGFEYGSVSGTTYTREGETAGKLFEGPNGLAQIAVPSAAGAAPGATLSRPVAFTGETALAGGGVDWGDRAPGGSGAPDAADTNAGADYVVGDCAAPAQSSGGSSGAPAAGVQSVSLDRTRLTARYHRLLSVTGRITPATAGVRVELVDAAGTVLGHRTTTADGRFAIPLRVKRNAQLRARAAGVGSATLPLTVRPLVRMREHSVKRGLRITGSVRPNRSGAADVEQRAGGQWIVVATTTLRRGRFSVLVRGVHRGRFRLVLQDPTR